MKPYQTKETKVKHRFRQKEGNSHFTDEREASLPTFNTDDIEQLIKVILSFNEHCHDDFLHLTKYQDRFIKFPKVLQGEGRETWLQLVREFDDDVNYVEDPNDPDGWIEKPNVRSLQTFKELQKNFVAKYLNKGSYNIQRTYLVNRCKMTYRTTPDKVYSRLKELNILVKWFPGVKRIPFDDNDMKEIFHNIMPQADQEAYTDTGKQWYDENVTIHEMVQYFTNADSKRKHNY